MHTFIIYFLTLLGIAGYIFIAGVFLVAMRMQYFALVNERNFSYAVMEDSIGINFMDHIMSFLWPIVILFSIIFQVAAFIYKIRSKYESARF